MHYFFIAFPYIVVGDHLIQKRSESLKPVYSRHISAPVPREDQYSLVIFIFSDLR